MGDILFSTIETFHASLPWGRLLDAGTGIHSLKWIQTLNTDAYTAITADSQMCRNILADETIKPLRSTDSLIVGNWMDENFCRTLGKYDTILADYLIGAVDGFSPYEQDVIIEKLKQHLSPNGRLYIIGMNPIPDEAPIPANVVVEVRRVRDACILLAGHRPYREFPLSWMTRHLSKAKFKTLKTKKFTILHSEESILRQIRVGYSKLALMPKTSIRHGMEQYLLELTESVKQAVNSTKDKKIPLSFDYIIAAIHEECELPPPNPPL